MNPDQIGATVCLVAAFVMFVVGTVYNEVVERRARLAKQRRLEDVSDTLLRQREEIAKDAKALVDAAGGDLKQALAWHREAVAFRNEIEEEVR